MELTFQLAKKKNYRPIKGEMMSLSNHRGHKTVLRSGEEFGSKRGKHAMN